MDIPRILITPGEPAGIGPDITVQIAQSPWPAELVVLADPLLLKKRAAQLGLPLQLIECDVKAIPQSQSPGVLKILPIPLSLEVKPGQLAPTHAKYVVTTLERGALLAWQKIGAALVTGPVHKETINAGGIPFRGHTEFFAHFCHVPHTVMLFVVNTLKVALVTTHLPLAQVPSAITQERLERTLSILNRALTQQFHIATPRIGVCGLNPHAGEGGYLGREEIDTIAPLLEKMRKQHYIITGPLPADTIFTQKHLQEFDAVLAMYHDQALPLVKYIGFGHAINVTLGLPFVRTSVDHGTALDIAGSGKADAGSMREAIRLAIMLSTS